MLHHSHILGVIETANLAAHLQKRLFDNSCAFACINATRLRFQTSVSFDNSCAFACMQSQSGKERIPSDLLQASGRQHVLFSLRLSRPVDNRLPPRHV